MQTPFKRNETVGGWDAAFAPAESDFREPYIDPPVDPVDSIEAENIPVKRVNDVRGKAVVAACMR